MNWEQIESKWEQLMASAKENWAKLSDEDLQQTCRQTRATLSQDPGNLRNHQARSRKASMGLGRRAWSELRRKLRKYSCIPSNQAVYYPKANGLNVEITDLTPVQKLSVSCPTCAAAPQERCCEISNGVFRQDPHFGRLLSAAGQGVSSRQLKLATNMLPNFNLR